MYALFKRLKKKLFLFRLLSLYRSPKKAIDAWQSKRLCRLVRHAGARVPFYRELFASHHLIPSSVRGLSDLSRIPITRKAMFLERPEEEYVNGSRRAHTAWKKTSGTAGQPLSFYVSSAILSSQYVDFACFRFLMQGSRSLKPFSKVRIAHINVRSPKKKNQLFVTIEEYLSHSKETLEKINAYKPDIVTSYASLVFDIAQKVHKDPTLLPHTPRWAVTFGEMLTPSMRTFIEETLRCEVYDRYGGGEIGAVALECAQHDGMHVNSESAIVEIVDEEGRSVPDGTQGKVIVTDLLNYNMPFIRYDIGDGGTLVSSPCACGLETPRLYIHGRYSAFIDLAGRKVHHLEFDAALDGLMNVVLQYQIVKTGTRSLCVRVVPGPLFDETSAKKIEESVRGVVGADVSINVESVPSIPKTPRGKSVILADESTAEA